MKFKPNPILMDGTPGAGGGDGGGAGAGAGAGGGDGDGGNGGDASVLGAGAGGGEGGGGSNPGPYDYMPEKFRVMAGDKLDVEASAKKLAESYAGLEKRVGAGAVAPKEAKDYTVTVPDAFKEGWEEGDRIQAFRDEAHKLGFSQQQFDFLMGKYFDLVPDLVKGAQIGTAEDAVAALRADPEWKTDAQFKAQASLAHKAFTAFFPKDLWNLVDGNPMLLQGLAKIGAEMQEDGGIPAGGDGGNAEDISALMASPAYWDEKHADHKAVTEKVKKFYEKKHGTTPVV